MMTDEKYQRKEFHGIASRKEEMNVMRHGGLLG